MGEILQVIFAPILIFENWRFGIEVVISGLLSGVMYSLIALGFVLIYKASGMFNFAQGVLVLFAALNLAGFIGLGVPIPLAIVITIGVMILFAIVWEFLVLRHLVNQEQIILFMATIGLNGGSKVLEALATVGPLLMICGVVVTIVPVMVAFLVGKYFMKMNQAILMGAITGAMTSTASLNIVMESAKSQVPALGYAGSYTFANVILTFFGALLVFM